MGIHLRLGGDDWGIIFTWDSFQPSTPALVLKRHLTPTTSLSGMICHRLVVTFNTQPKYKICEVSSFIHYEVMNGDEKMHAEKRVIWGWLLFTGGYP